MSPYVSSLSMIGPRFPYDPPDYEARALAEQDRRDREDYEAEQAVERWKARRGGWDE